MRSEQQIWRASCAGSVPSQPQNDRYPEQSKRRIGPGQELSWPSLNVPPVSLKATVRGSSPWRRTPESTGQARCTARPSSFTGAVWGTSGAHADGTGRATKLEPPYRPYSSALSLHGVQAVVHLHHRGPASRWLVSQLVKALLRCLGLAARQRCCFGALITPEVATTPRSSRAPPDRTSWRSVSPMSQAQECHA